MMRTVLAVLAMNGFSTMAGAAVQGTAEQDALRRAEARFEAEIARLRADYDRRLAAMEDEVRRLRETDPSAAAELERRVEELHGDLSAHPAHHHEGESCLDARHGPEVSVVGDLVFVVSDRRDAFESANRFVLRSVEVGLGGHVDERTSYHVLVHVDEHELELEEAYVTRRDFLDASLQVRAGRFNADFGRLSPLHDHELPFVDKPGVLQEYLGGSLRGTGLELGHRTTLGDGADLRSSIGILNAPEGDVHAVVGLRDHGHDDEDEDLAEIFGERDIGSFAYTARVSLEARVGRHGLFQVGSSLAWAPGVRSLIEIEDEEDDVRDLEKLVLGFDVGYRDIDPRDGHGFEAQLELLLNRQEFGDETGSIARHTAFGGHGLVVYHFDRAWSVGASFGAFEHAEEPDTCRFDGGVFVTWRPDPHNRLRLEIRHVDDELDDESFWVGMIQWTVTLGSHDHGAGF